jgi:hypothetical protein
MFYKEKKMSEMQLYQPVTRQYAFTASIEFPSECSITLSDLHHSLENITFDASARKETSCTTLFNVLEIENHSNVPAARPEVSFRHFGPRENTLVSQASQHTGVNAAHSSILRSLSNIQLRSGLFDEFPRELTDFPNAVSEVDESTYEYYSMPTTRNKRVIHQTRTFCV